MGTTQSIEKVLDQFNKLVKQTQVAHRISHGVIEDGSFVPIFGKEEFDKYRLRDPVRFDKFRALLEKDYGQEIEFGLVRINFRIYKGYSDKSLL